MCIFTDNEIDLCYQFEHWFKDPHYFNKGLWTICSKEEIYDVDMIDFKSAHEHYGCGKLNKIKDKCPRSIFLPIITLMYHCNINEACIYLFRDQDEAIGIKTDKFTYLLIKDTTQGINTHGFHIVTK